MTISPFIRKILASILLILFGFSMLPKKTVHDLFARHKDSYLIVKDEKASQISWAGFHCHCENFVVESPFIGYSCPAAILMLPIHGVNFIHQASPFPHPSYVDFNLRGPPSSRIC